MKSIIKILLSTLFIVGSAFMIYKLIINFSNNSLMFGIIAFTLFFIHIFVWVAPKTFYKLCWKITNFMPDNFDYESGYRKLELVSLGLLITSILILVIGFIIA